jgi:hypothetical protein
VLAGAFAILSVGIGAAAIILGKTLPTLAEGLISFGEVDGGNLVLVGAGVGALGLGLMALAGGQAAKGSVDFLEGLGQLFGGQSTIDKLKDFANIGPGLVAAGEGLMTFTKALNGLTYINTDKLNTVAASMANLNQSIPRPSFTEVAGNFLTGLTKPIVQAADQFITGRPQSTTQATDINLTDLIGVNTQMLAVMKEVATQNKNAVRAIKALNTNLYA